jgi:nucleoside phosphorylase
MLHILCALRHEARPIIDHYRLAHDGSARLFASYRNRQDGITLTVAGVGRQSAAAATQFAASHYHAGTGDLWLNIGIAGHRSLPIGTPVLASRVVDAADGRCWRPRITFQTRLQRLPLITAENPAAEYPDEAMVDMEAAGFYRSACLVSSMDTILCLKIISDNAAHSTNRISRRSVRELITSNLAAVDTLIKQVYGHAVTAAVIP